MSQAAVVLSPGEAIERLQTPAAIEDFAHLTGAAMLLVDLAAESRAVSQAALDGARRALARLPCPTIGIHSASPAVLGEALADRLDVTRDAADDAECIAAAVARAPQASAALVQLLRMTESMEIHDALVAESLVYSTLQSGPEFAAWIEQRGTSRPPAPNPEPPVLSHREGDRLELRLNRPERRNAFSAAMRDALVEALAVAAADEAVQIVLTGAGPAFCSGGDLAEFGSLPDPSTAHAVRMTRNAARMLADFAPRARAEVHGACVGAGIELPAFTSHVAARADAFFLLPEVSMGLVPGAGGTASIPRRIGRQRTAWLALTGSRVDPATALSWGLIDEVID